MCVEKKGVKGMGENVLKKKIFLNLKLQFSRGKVDILSHFSL